MNQQTVRYGLVILAALGANGCNVAGDDDSGDTDLGLDEASQLALGVSSAALADDADLALASAPRLTCADLASRVQLPGLVVSSAVEVPASSGSVPSYPAHCLLAGQLDARVGIDGKPYAIGFELRMPLTAYDRRFFFQGGGGTDGVINPAFGDLLNTSTTNALSRGYAVVSTDGGHATGPADATFGLDPQARIDYGYNAVGRVTHVSKAILSTYYGRAPRRSYFVGCSNGGRQGLVAAARFGDQFDGILASAPGMNLPKAALAQAWDTQQFMSAAAPGQLPKDAFLPEAIAAVASGINARCDALDGVADGMVNDVSACRTGFDLERDVPTCAGAPSAGCLSVAQKAALARVFAGVKNGSGQSLYSDWIYDPGIAGGGWRFWKLDSGFTPFPLNTLTGAGALGYIFTTPPDAPDLSDAGFGYQLGFNFDTGGPKIFATDATYTESAMQFMTPPNPTQLSRFKGHGKLIVVHGGADPVFSANDTIAWYRALLGADSHADAYARLFLVPGMNHCSGGPATDRFDMLPVLEDWVEHDVAPRSVVAAVDPANPDVIAQGWSSTRTRPLCAYPKRAVFRRRATDIEQASSFECK